MDGRGREAALERVNAILRAVEKLREDVRRAAGQGQTLCIAFCDPGVRWVSAGSGDFEVEAIERAARGTSVTLHLRDDADDDDNAAQQIEEGEIAKAVD